MDWLYPVGFENMDELTMTEEELAARPMYAKLFRSYERRKLRAIDDFLEDCPTAEKSKVATCLKCGLTSTRFNVETHKCKGAPKTTAST